MSHQAQVAHFTVSQDRCPKGYAPPSSIPIERFRAINAKRNAVTTNVQTHHRYVVAMCNEWLKGGEEALELFVKASENGRFRTAGKRFDLQTERSQVQMWWYKDPRVPKDYVPPLPDELIAQMHQLNAIKKLNPKSIDDIVRNKRLAVWAEFLLGIRKRKTPERRKTPREQKTPRLGSRSLYDLTKMWLADDPENTRDKYRVPAQLPIDQAQRLMDICPTTQKFAFAVRRGCRTGNWDKAHLSKKQVLPRYRDPLYMRPRARNTVLDPLSVEEYLANHHKNHKAWWANLQATSIAAANNQGYDGDSQEFYGVVARPATYVLELTLADSSKSEKELMNEAILDCVELKIMPKTITMRLGKGEHVVPFPLDDGAFKSWRQQYKKRYSADPAIHTSTNTGVGSHQANYSSEGE